MEKISLDTQLALSKVEADYHWREWIKEIPPLHFKPEWDVIIIPPYGGAIARFLVRYHNKKVSCYLDCYDELGYFGAPYWEIYPYEDDIYRIRMNDTKELMEKIQEVLEEDENE